MYASTAASIATAALALFAGYALAQADVGVVERSGQHAVLQIEQVLTGNLTELNGKYKIRVALVTYDPGGFIGNHHHAGPGLRCVIKGNLTYIQQGTSSVYGPGDCFYESGSVDHHAFNDSEDPVELYNFQILPSDWSGSSAITVTPIPEN